MSYANINLNQRQAGKQSIGAVATEKVQSDALNLGYPAAYQSVYAAKRLPERFFPTIERQPMTMWAGNDLQSAYHQQKKADADFMAGAKVRSTQLSRMRYVGTPHGMGLLPKAQLSQRHFANPSNGALMTASGRQSHSDAPYHYAGSDYASVYRGGVLRTAQGQAFGMALLRNRVSQLNDIATAKADFVSGTMPAASGVSTQSFAPSSMSAGSPAIELNLLLQSIIDSLNASQYEESAKLDKFDLTTAGRALALIFRLAPESNSDFIEDTQAKVETILELLNGSLDPEQESAGMSSTARQTALSLQVLFTKVDVYLKRMIGGAPVQRQEARFNPLTQRNEVVNVLFQEQGENLSTPERVALSKNLVSSLGFSKLLKYAGDANDSGLLSEAQRDRLFTAQQAQRFAEGDMDSDAPPDDDGDFDMPEEVREDTAHRTETGTSRSARDFSEDERTIFGFNSGMYYPSQGRAPNAYIDDEAPPSAPFRPSVGGPVDSTPAIRGLRDPETGEYGVQRVRSSSSYDQYQDAAAPPQYVSLAQVQAQAARQASAQPNFLMDTPRELVAPTRSEVERIMANRPRGPMGALAYAGEPAPSSRASTASTAKISAARPAPRLTIADFMAAPKRTKPKAAPPSITSSKMSSKSTSSSSAAAAPSKRPVGRPRKERNPVGRPEKAVWNGKPLPNDSAGLEAVRVELASRGIEYKPRAGTAPLRMRDALKRLISSAQKAGKL
tara:strand:+ start:90 stop:2273 length:2184 start_codon:yes stop_codon:yes gene_type:complete